MYQFYFKYESQFNKVTDLSFVRLRKRCLPHTFIIVLIEPKGIVEVDTPLEIVHDLEHIDLGGISLSLFVLIKLLVQILVVLHGVNFI